MAMDRIGGKVVETLGRGAFGVASLVKLASGELRVVKQVDLSGMEAPDREASHKEVGVLRQLKHPHIVEYFDSYLEEAMLCIVMEFADAGDLAKAVRERKDSSEPFPESTALKYFGQCLLALRYCHGKKILHRDIKCQNILLTAERNVVKLADFGVAKVQEATTAIQGTTVGTPNYMAPEICEDLPYGQKVDIWSMGVVLHEMVALALPFVASNIAALIMKIVGGDPAPLPSGASDELREVLGAALAKKPESRASAADLLKFDVVKRNLSGTSVLHMDNDPDSSSMADFERVRHLGRGASGEAVLMRYLRGTGTPYRVIKTVAASRCADAKKAEEEVKVLRRLAHPHIVAYFDCFQDNGALHIVLEYADGGDLASDLRARTEPYEEREAMRVFGQCLLALRYIHKRRIVHRDIKSQNLFLTSGRDVKLGDFGIAKVMQETLQEPTELVGTPSFLAPEMCKNERYDGKVDIWALGVVLYELVSLVQPFLCNNIAATILKIVSGNPEPLPEKLSAGVRDVVDKILQKKPQSRPSAGSLLELPVVSECLDTGALNVTSVSGDLEYSDDEWHPATLDSALESLPEEISGELDTASTGQVLKDVVRAGDGDNERTAQFSSGLLSHDGAGAYDPERTMATSLSTTVGSVPEAATKAAEPAEPELPGESTTLVSVDKAARLVEEPSPAEEEPAQSSADVLSSLTERAQGGDSDVMILLVKQIIVMHKQTGVHCTVFAASCAEQWTQLTEVKATIKKGQETMDKKSMEAQVCKCLAQAVDNRLFQMEERAWLAETVKSAKSGRTDPADSDAGRAGEAKSDGEEGEDLEDDDENAELLRTLSAANAGGKESDFEAHIAEIVRLGKEFGDRPKELADALVNEWSGDLREKVKTLKGLVFDKETQKEQYTARKVLINVLEERQLGQETKEYHETLAREKADALASPSHRKKAAGAALSAVRQKRMGAST
jgi:NIMA (never in mitosis gene a)-related kinase